MIEKRALTMSIKEITRCEILKMADEKQITQREGAKRTSVSERHFRRLLYNYRKKGAEGDHLRSSRERKQQPDTKRET